MSSILGYPASELLKLSHSCVSLPFSIAYSFISKLQRMFTNASAYLYEATRKRAYFKEVTILLPQSWTPRPGYQLPGNKTFGYSDVIVAPPNPRWAPLQYTKQYQGCGERGVHIHFMDKFLTDPTTELYYGPHGNVHVHLSARPEAGMEGS